LVSRGTSNFLQGHHSTCGKFSTHIFRVRNRTYCAACIGLLYGGMLSLMGAVVYFFSNWHVAEFSTPIIFLGIIGVVIGLFQFKFKSFVRLFVNTIFVLGSLLILIGIDESVNSIFIDLFVLSLIVFWLFARISLSHWDHKTICFGCETKNCRVRE
jgi:hypothetical protein